MPPALQGYYTLLIKLTVLFVMCHALAGCAKTAYDVKVDTIAADDYTSQGMVCIILPSTKGTDIDDLYFLEVTKNLYPYFTAHDIQTTQDLSNANCVIFIQYGIGDRQNKTSTYSIPTYGVTGYTPSSVVGSYNNVGTFSGSVYNTPTYGVTGYTSHSIDIESYTRFLKLSAYKLDVIQNKLGKMLWATYVSSRGTSSDLRALLPIMMLPLKDTLAQKGKAQIKYDIYENFDGTYKVVRY